MMIMSKLVPTSLMDLVSFMHFLSKGSWQPRKQLEQLVTHSIIAPRSFLFSNSVWIFVFESSKAVELLTHNFAFSVVIFIIFDHCNSGLPRVSSTSFLQCF